MRILLVDDQRASRVVMRRLLEVRPDLELLEAAGVAEARQLLETREVDALLLDIRLSDAPGDRGGLDFLRWVRGTGRSMPAVMVTGVGELAEIREAMRQGAQDYVLKDELCAEMILPIVDGLRERYALRDQVQRLREQMNHRQGLAALRGSSPSLERIRKLVRRVADADAPILLRGATGTGKEMVARAIHFSGKRGEQPLLAVNCSALPGSLIESLIFGHQRGAFTGADRRMRGQLELAGGGTVLLDEIAEMPVELQAKLLRVLEDRKFRPLGSEEEVTLEARIIAASHVDLERRIAEGKFREDLYFRLNVVTIDVPALSERTEDIPDLVQAFAAEQARPLRFTAEAMGWLRARHWPGNVRELRNVVERLALLADSDVIDVASLEEHVGQDNALIERELTRLAKSLLMLTTREPSKLDAIQRAVVDQALQSAGGNKSAAARLLGVHRKMLERMVKSSMESSPDEDDPQA